MKIGPIYGRNVNKKTNIHEVLDVVGLVPVGGEAFDLINAGIYHYQGDNGNALLSAGSAVPIAGYAASGIKLVNKGTKCAGATTAINKTVIKGGIETGITAKNGIKIEGFTSHEVDRAIGDGMKRAGVKPESILDAIKNPLKINNVVTDQFGRQSQRFIGETAEVVINPSTGKIVSINPTSSSKAAKLLKELGVQK